MKFFAQRPLTINGGEIRPGDLVAEVNPAPGIPLERAVNAIACGHATPEKREAPKAAKAAAAAEPEKK